MRNEQQLKGDFEAMLGKRITGIQVREDADFHSTQIFLAFDDETYFEIYSDGRIKGVRHIYSGDMQTIRELSPGNSDIMIDVEETNHGLLGT